MSQNLSPRAQALGLVTIILREQKTLDEALHAAPLTGEAADQRFAMLLTLTVLQHLGQLDALIAKYLEKPLPAKRHAITNALRLGLAQLLILNVPAHAAVNETVAMVKRGKDAGLSGLVNAILQKAVREKPTLPAPIANLPAWLRFRWEKTYGAEQVAAIAEIATRRAPLDINSSIDIEGAERIDSHIQRMGADHPAVETLPGYAQGSFFIQDLAASYPVRLLGDVRGLRVLDLCSAPGGKAAQLARAGAHVTALDRSPSRMKIVQQNFTRLKIDAEIITADALTWNAPALFDAILLDAPCSATGTWRRHPEVVHIASESDIAELASLQRKLLTRAWEWLKPGGKLVYCVCSLEPEEGETQLDWFLQNQLDATLAPIPPTTEIPNICLTRSASSVRTLPAHLAEKGGMDGFFAVAFRKQ